MNQSDIQKAIGRGKTILVIDDNTRIQEFREKLRWNDLYYHLNTGL